MVENSVLNYLLTDSTLLGLLGGTKVYYHRVPKEIKMPWVSLSVSFGGTRKRLTQRKYSEIVEMFSVETEDERMVRGRNIAERVLRLLENYRGDMGDIEDVKIFDCTPIRPMDGYGGTFRFIFNFFIKYKELTTYPATV